MGFRLIGICKKLDPFGNGLVIRLLKHQLTVFRDENAIVIELNPSKPKMSPLNIQRLACKKGQIYRKKHSRIHDPMYIKTLHQPIF